MSYFEGTIKEFTKFVGPFAKNKVAYLSSKYKRQIGKCENCGATTNNLDAAHIKGKERPLLIAEILKDFIDDDLIKIDLEEFEERFVNSHNPIESTIKVLCKECHREYDKTEKRSGISEIESYINEAEIIEKLVNREMNKSKAMLLASSRTHLKINNSNTMYSNIIETQNGWWLQPDNDKFKSEFHMILNDEKSKKLYFFTMPANSIENPGSFFKQRNDKHYQNRSNIYIPTSGLSFKEKNGFDFSPFLIDKISYN